MELVYSRQREEKKAAETDDRELALRARAGDSVAFETLVVRKTPAVVSVARRILGDAEEARDVAQLVFLRVWDSLARYDEKYSFNTWLYRIATNLSIDFLRANRSRERAHGATLHLVRRREAAIEEEATLSLEAAQVAQLFETVSSGLSEKQKAAFVLRELEDLDSAEVARVLGCRESTVRNHLFNARKALQKRLRKDFPSLLTRWRRK
ncbi:MAG: RNA polymerase sigma factor [Thermoanaerobaculia bacterium]